MSFAFHPQAAERFNEQAEGFKARLTVDKPTDNPDQFKDIPISGSITDDDIAGDIRYSTIDEAGNPTATHFFYEGEWWGLSGDAFRDFYSFCEQLSATGPIKGLTSVQFILRVSIKWVEKNLKEETKESFTEYLREQCIADIAERQIYFPLDGFYVRTSFEFGPFKICHCDPERFDDLFPFPNNVGDDEKKKEYITAEREKYRKKFQGKPLALISIKGDEEFTKQKAREEAEKVFPALNLFLGYPFSLDLVSYVGPSSFRPIPTFVFINHDQDGFDSIKSGMLDSVNEPTLTPEGLAHSKKMLLFDQVSALLKFPNTPFKTKLADSLRLMGLGCCERNLSNRLVYTMVALESLFMKNDSEPIQENVGYRLAICSVQKAEDRIEVTKIFKQAYDMRSKYIHHGRTVEVREDLKKFFMWATFGLLAAVRNADRFSSKEEFIAAIDMKKFQ